MYITRQKYLDKLISQKDKAIIKVITGIRRCGKSVLLFDIYILLNSKTFFLNLFLLYEQKTTP